MSAQLHHEASSEQFYSNLHSWLLVMVILQALVLSAIVYRVYFAPRPPALDIEAASSTTEDNHQCVGSLYQLSSLFTSSSSSSPSLSSSSFDSFNEKPYDIVPRKTSPYDSITTTPYKSPRFEDIYGPHARAERQAPVDAAPTTSESFSPQRVFGGCGGLGRDNVPLSDL